ncbi:MAG: hypothetical protein DBX43_04180 [Coriobacteriia bacterium]|nr:MAG: hypothetical protein DBX43_04180 [Coriobacteriia bacterium]
MSSYIAVDPDKCIGCNTCEAVCASSHRKAGMQRRHRLIHVANRGVSSVVTCHHCKDAPCANVCPVGALRSLMVWSARTSSVASAVSCALSHALTGL